MSARRVSIAVAAASLCIGCVTAGSVYAGNDSARAKGASPGVIAAQQAVSRAKSIPKFVAPGPAFNARGVKGKTIFVIPFASTVPQAQAVISAQQSVAKKLGFKLVVYPNQGQPSQWGQGVTAGIARKAAAIILEGPDPRVLTPQLIEARRAHIPVVVGGLFDESSPPPANVTASSPRPFNRVARVMADYAVADSNGTANILVVTSNEVNPSPRMVASIQSETTARCASTCKVTVVNVPAAQWATEVQTSVQSALQRDPTINYVIPLYDAEVQWAAPAITAVNAAGKVKIVTFNASSFVLKMIEDHNIVTADIGESNPWIALAQLDEAFRIILHKKPLKTERTGFRLFDSSNVLQTGNPPSQDKGYGSAYLKGYYKLWGLSK